ncbi:MAG: hypothetical protein ACFFDT_24050, partial [Candidatus Hodarchaeota archaeon]
MKNKFITVFFITTLFMCIIPNSVTYAEKQIEAQVNADAVFINDKLTISRWNGKSTIEVFTPKVEGYQYEVHESENRTEIDIVLEKPPSTN